MLLCADTPIRKWQATVTSHSASVKSFYSGRMTDDTKSASITLFLFPAVETFCRNVSIGIVGVIEKGAIKPGLGMTKGHSCRLAKLDAQNSSVAGEHLRCLLFGYLGDSVAPAEELPLYPGQVGIALQTRVNLNLAASRTKSASEPMLMTVGHRPPLVLPATTDAPNKLAAMPQPQ